MTLVADVLTLPMAANRADHAAMPYVAPTETPRLLKEWRLGHREYMSQERAAQKLGVKWRSYVRWENGENNPSRSSVEHLARKLGLKIEDFYPVGEEGPAQTRERIAIIQEQVNEMHE